MFIHPLFSYYAQFYILPSHTLLAVQKGLQTLIGGASHWLPPPLASRLRLFFHYPFPPRDLLCDNLASCSRALVSHRRLPLSERRALRVFMAPSAKNSKSICAHLLQAASQLRQYQVSIDTIMQEHDLRPSKSIHSLFYSALLVGNDKVGALTSTILTRRLQRWSFPAWVTSLYFTASLKSALPLPPRVVWTFISLVLNGWLTARRFQK